ncbi:hypothetical protein E4U19_007784 [Claviceps sp. Clav32 group G5]|nr:hypothetical protein E4U19_007784 [Claviceps sp. Clav32 group G5]
MSSEVCLKPLWSIMVSSTEMQSLPSWVAVIWYQDSAVNCGTSSELTLEMAEDMYFVVGDFTAGRSWCESSYKIGAKYVQVFMILRSSKNRFVVLVLVQ